MTKPQMSGFVNMLVNAPNITGDIMVVTTEMNIITDMIDSSVRVLTEDGNIVPSPTKPFAANIHTIRYELLENKHHQTSEEEKTIMQKRINTIITKINDAEDTGLTESEINDLQGQIDVIGEDLISRKLGQMLRSLPVL